MDPDRIYAMPLSQPPTEREWADSLALPLGASGGASSMVGEGDVDKDSVHKATASCHHGTAAQPIKLEAKAFYTPRKIYLRISWQDPTGDYGPAWSMEGGRWKAAGNRRDGVGVLWGEPGTDFNCSRTCHLRDWRKGGGRAFADYAMATGQGLENDFWIWRAGRGGSEGATEDGRLTFEGRLGDGAGDFEAPNSQAALKGPAAPGVFGDDDAPRKTGGEFTPGYLVVATEPGRLEVESRASRKDGVWTLTLSRDLAGRDVGDVTFRPGGEYSFGLAILDGVARDHNAVSGAIKLKLVKPDETSGIAK